MLQFLRRSFVIPYSHSKYIRSTSQLYGKYLEIDSTSKLKVTKLLQNSRLFIRIGLKVGRFLDNFPMKKERLTWDSSFRNINKLLISY